MARKLKFKVKVLKAPDSSATGIEALSMVLEVFGTRA